MGLIKKLWTRRWCPDAYYKNMAVVPFEKYYAQGYRLLLLDIDNTLTVHGEREKSQFAAVQLERLGKIGFDLVILSNAMRDRAKAMGESLGVPAIGQANKPSIRGIKEACEMFARQPAETLLCGDQIFTDIWAGRNAGIATILVAPHQTVGEPFQIVIKRKFERRLLRRFTFEYPYDKILQEEETK